jgi:phenylalanyl-tRNA synthetase alpha chain
MSKIETLEKEILGQISAAADEASLEEVRVAALGKKGRVSDLMKGLGKMDPEQRKVMGPALNGLKSKITDAITARKAALHNVALDARLETERVDVTLPVPPQSEGRIHPVTQVTDELSAIFADMGFAVAEGPDIETDEMNFEALNIPAEHPARQMHDTFYFPENDDGERYVLRTHTSPVQIRTMMQGPPPYRISAGPRIPV